MKNECVWGGPHRSIYKFQPLCSPVKVKHRPKMLKHVKRVQIKKVGILMLLQKLYKFNKISNTETSLNTNIQNFKRKNSINL